MLTALAEKARASYTQHSQCCLLYTRSAERSYKQQYIPWARTYCALSVLHAKSAIGTRAFQATPIPEKAKQGYTSLVKSLLAEEASNEPIELSSGASEILETLFYEVEGRLRNLG